MAPNILMKTFFVDQNKIELNISNLNDFKQPYTFETQKEFVRYIREILKYIVSRYSLNNPDFKIYTDISNNIDHFKFFTNIDFVNSDKILDKNVKIYLKNHLNILYQINKDFKIYLLDKKNPNIPKQFNLLIKAINNLDLFLYNWKDEIPKYNLFDKTSCVFLLTQTNICSLKFRKSKYEEIEIKLSEEDQIKLEKFCDSLDFITGCNSNSPVGKNYLIKRSISQKTFFCTLLGESNNFNKENIFGIIKIDDNIIIDLDKNKIMYDILKKMVNGSRHQSNLYNNNMPDKIKAFNFYHNYSEILELHVKNIKIQNNKKLYGPITYEGDVKLGNYFNNLYFIPPNAHIFDTIIFANPSEIDKFQDELCNGKTIVNIFFTEKSIEKFNLSYLHIPYYTDNINVKIYPGKGKLKNKLLDLAWQIKNV